MITTMEKPRTSAVFSEDRVYRYRLERHWTLGRNQINAGVLNIIGLNPSTADEVTDDPTIRRCVGFARDWNFSGLVMTNLFAWRATDPFQLRYQHASAQDLIGPENNHHLLQVARSADRVVVAWGHLGSLLGRDLEVLNLLMPYRSIWTFGLTKTGHPKHPLYLPKTTKPMLWM